MEPVTIGLILLLGYSLSEENKKQDEYITELHYEIIELEASTYILEGEVADLEAWNYRLSGELSDLAGQENMNNGSQQDQIDALVRKVLSE